MSKTKKVAICFYGLTGSLNKKYGIGKNLDPKIAFKYYKKNILNKDTDVFIHSWSVNFKKELVKLYKPKSHIIERQKNFKTNYSNFEFKKIYYYFKLFIKFLLNQTNLKEQLKISRIRSHAIKSRWLSSKKVLNLKDKYEKKHKFKYDIVLLTRLDLIFLKKINLKKIDSNFFYASNWNSVNFKNKKVSFKLNNMNRSHGFMDLWFISNTDNMNLFSRLYDYLDKIDTDSPHRQSYNFAKKMGFKIKYFLFRWKDYELVRRKIFRYKV